MHIQYIKLSTKHVIMMLKPIMKQSISIQQYNTVTIKMWRKYDTIITLLRIGHHSSND